MDASGSGRAAPASAPPPPPPASGWDVVVVTTKALPDLVDDSATIAPVVQRTGDFHGESCRPTAIVLIQNGVGVEAPYRARFPGNPIVSGVTVVSAEQVADGVVRQNRWTRLTLGPYYGATSHHEGGNGDGNDGRTAEMVERAGVDAMRFLARFLGPGFGGIKDVETLEAARDLQTVRWHKLCINASVNPSSVLSGGLGPAEMVADDELRLHLRGVMLEIWEGGAEVINSGEEKSRQTKDADKKQENPFQRLGLAHPDRILSSIARNAGAHPSMLLDWESGRPLELEIILGNAVRAARARGIELPRCQTLYALLRSAARERKKGHSGADGTATSKDRGELGSARGKL